MSKYLDPTIDLTFKKVFGTHKNLVMSLLNAMLPLPDKCQIEELEYIDPEQIPENPTKKYSIVDVKCKDNKGRYFIVEMQTCWNSAFFRRALYNSTQTYSTQLDRADTYNRLRNVYALSIVNDIAFPKYDNEYIQEYYITNKNHTDDRRNDIVLVFVELPKFNPSNKSDKKMLDLWMKFLTEINENTKEVDADLLKTPETVEALGLMERAAFTDAELELYRKQRLDEITQRTIQENLLEKGREKGRAEGRAEGEKNAKLDMARKMKSMQMPVENIVAISGLSKEEIENL